VEIIEGVLAVSGEVSLVPAEEVIEAASRTRNGTPVLAVEGVNMRHR
jgi:hypothetical protein